MYGVFKIGVGSGERFSGLFYRDDIRGYTSSIYQYQPDITNISEWIILNSENPQSNILNSESESRPKTKFFSLMIYAGYPMQ